MTNSQLKSPIRLTVPADLIGVKKGRLNIARPPKQFTTAALLDAVASFPKQLTALPDSTTF